MLGRKKVSANTQVDAKKNRFGRREALALAAKAEQIYVSKGRKTIHLDLRKTEHSEDEIAGLLLGPTGNLRAPALRVGRILIIGFDEQVYSEILN